MPFRNDSEFQPRSYPSVSAAPVVVFRRLITGDEAVYIFADACASRFKTGQPVLKQADRF